jgi:hypothetical protein
MSSGTAREHVRVARALRDLPVIRGEFGAGRAHRQCSRADDAAARVRRRLTWRFEEDGSLAGTFRLPPLQGAILLKALRAAAADVEPQDVSEETPPGDPADPARCHVEDGDAVSVTTAQMISCTAALSWMLHGRDGAVLLEQRRPDGPGEPGQLVPASPHGRPRPRLPHHPRSRRCVHLLPARRHRDSAEPGPAVPGRRHRPGPRRGRDRPEPGRDHDTPPGVTVFGPGDWYPLLLEFDADQPGSWQTDRISFPDWLHQRNRSAASTAPAA